MWSKISDRFKTEREQIQHRLTEKHLTEKGPLDSSFSDVAGIKPTAAAQAVEVGHRRCSRRGSRVSSKQSTQQDMSDITKTAADCHGRRPSSTSQRETSHYSFLDSRKLSRIYKGVSRSLSLRAVGRRWS